MLAVGLFLIVLPILTSCVTRGQVRAEVWMQSGIPIELCHEQPDLMMYGIYRKLDSGQYEFISYCSETADEAGKLSPNVQNYIVFNAAKFYSLLDQLLPKGRK